MTFTHYTEKKTKVPGYLQIQNGSYTKQVVLKYNAGIICVYVRTGRLCSIFRIIYFY